MMMLTRCQDHILTENILFVWSETSYSGNERRCYRCGTNEQTNEQTVKIELLSRWKLEAEFPNSEKHLFSYVCTSLGWSFYRGGVTTDPTHVINQPSISTYQPTRPSYLQILSILFCHTYRRPCLIVEPFHDFCHIWSSDFCRGELFFLWFVRRYCVVL